jgi:hypothetical protein
MLGRLRDLLTFILGNLFLAILILILGVIPLASIIGTLTVLEPFISVYTSASFPPIIGIKEALNYVIGFSATSLLISVYVFLSFFYMKDFELEEKIKATFMTSIFLVSTVRFLHYPTDQETYQLFRIILDQALIFLPFVGTAAFMRSIFLRDGESVNDVLSQVKEEIRSQDIMDTDLASHVSKMPVIGGLKRVRAENKTIIDFTLVLPVVGLASFFIEISVLAGLSKAIFALIAVLTIIVVFLSSSW